MNTKDILVIDDIRTGFLDTVTYARTLTEGIRILDLKTDWHELWLDHDLGMGETIMPVVIALEFAAHRGRPYDIGTIYVHTANPVGAETMMAALSPWYTVRRAWID